MPQSTMRRFWLIFAQAVTVCVAALFVVTTLRPDLLSLRLRPDVVTVLEPTAQGGQRPIVSFSDAARRAMPAVVNVYTRKDTKAPRHPFMDDPVFRFFFGDQFDPQTQRRAGLGSGVIASDKGYVLTNHHVIEGADEIEVALADGRKAAAKIVGRDPETDIAVLKIELASLPAIAFGHSEDVRVGDIVLAIGNPYGVGQTVTLGIVSALGRSGLGISTFENFIQTDAAINRGNSGGALVDVNGNLVGINSAIYSRSGDSIGIGFAIPANVARDVMQQLVEKGSVTRGYVGVALQDITEDIAASFKLKKAAGAIITDVVGGGPAEKAGVKPGDVLVAVNGKAVANSSAVLNTIAVLRPGDEATLTLIRDQAEISVKVVAGTRPKPAVPR